MLHSHTSTFSFQFGKKILILEIFFFFFFDALILEILVPLNHDSHNCTSCYMHSLRQTPNLLLQCSNPQSILRLIILGFLATSTNVLVSVILGVHRSSLN